MPSTRRYDAIILRDGLPLQASTNVMADLHRIQPMSIQHALEHEGYSIVEALEPGAEWNVELISRGWHAYLRAAESSTVTPATLAVRQLRQVTALAESTGGIYAGDGFLQDHAVAPILGATRAMLNYLEGDLELVADKLDSAILALAARFSIDPDTL